ncbi:hypothetical protein AB5N19_05538 [Seiridium cardinale]|uniref:Short-chain dehydrogenase/reductase n=1 Tax=Seiridium cardinale TaxID=138064 RepID=A0ABR2XDE1_9PEZI
MSDLSSLPNVTVVLLDVTNAGSGYAMPYLDIDIAFQHMLVEAKGIVATVGSTADLLGLAYQGVYCGSKAANRLMSESMRLELEPLGIKCLHITTSFVATAWFSTAPEFKLPDDSDYEPIAQNIKHVAQGHVYKMMAAAAYADRVVSDILAGK